MWTLRQLLRAYLLPYVCSSYANMAGAEGSNDKARVVTPGYARLSGPAGTLFHVVLRGRHGLLMHVMLSCTDSSYQASIICKTGRGLIEGRIL